MQGQGQGQGQGLHLQLLTYCCCLIAIVGLAATCSNLLQVAAKPTIAIKQQQ